MSKVVTTAAAALPAPPKSCLECTNVRAGSLALGIFEIFISSLLIIVSTIFLAKPSLMSYNDESKVKTNVYDNDEKEGKTNVLDNDNTFLQIIFGVYLGLAILLLLMAVMLVYGVQKYCPGFLLAHIVYQWIDLGCTMLNFIDFANPVRMVVTGVVIVIKSYLLWVVSNCHQWLKVYNAALKEMPQGSDPTSDLSPLLQSDDWDSRFHGFEKRVEV